MTDKIVYTDFSIELNCKTIENTWRELPTQIMKDPNATQNERMLAVHFLKLCEVVDKIASDLNYGTATVRVPESGIRVVPG